MVYKVENMDMNSLRNLGDEIKSKLGTGVIVLSSVHNGKISFVSMVTKDLTDKGLHAGNLIRDIAKSLAVVAVVVQIWHRLVVKT